MNFILDTNIYRNLVKNSNSAQIIELVKKVNSVNKLKNINIFFPISVAMELISHLNDENENERNECLNALTLLVEISVKKEFNYLNFDFVPPLNVLLGYYFFNNEKLFLKEATLIIEISAKLTGLAPLDVGESKLNFISNVRDNLNNDKIEIKNNIEEYFKSINKGGLDWQFFKNNEKERDLFFKKVNSGKSSKFIAESFMIRAFQINKSEFIRDYVNFEKYETFIIDFFPAIKMFELILHQIGNGTESLKNEFDKKWNTIIDISILFGFFYKRHKKINCTLVTEDKNMRKKLIENGLENNLLNLSEFEKIYEHY